VQHLECLTEQEKLVFRTAFEIDQRWSSSSRPTARPTSAKASRLTFSSRADIDKWDLHMLHWTAWEKGLKSLYYCRSKSIQRAGFAGSEKEKVAEFGAKERTDYEECLACQ
jgi:ribonucleoside-diphosphate reductase alpha chain